MYVTENYKKYLEDNKLKKLDDKETQYNRNNLY